MKHKAKSFIAVLLALCLMMSLGVGALADGESYGGDMPPGGSAPGGGDVQTNPQSFTVSFGQYDSSVITPTLTYTTDSSSTSTPINYGTQVPAGATISVRVDVTNGYRLTRIYYNDNTANTDVSNNSTISMPGNAISFNFEYAKEYSIEYTASGGTISGKTEAVEGEEVTVAISANTGFEYVADSLKVTQDGGTDVTVTNNTFTMPAGDVTVTATFKKVETPEPPVVETEHDVHIVNSEGGIVNANPGEAVKDTTIKLTNGSDYRHYFVGYKVWTESGKTVTVSNDSFTMPDEDVYVEGIFKLYQPTLDWHSIDVDKPYYSSVTVDSWAYETETVTFTVDTWYDYDYYSVSVWTDGGVKLSVTPLGNDKYSFTMPDDDVTIYVDYDYVGTYSITKDVEGDGSIYVRSSADHGDTVWIEAAPNAGQSLTSLRVFYGEPWAYGDKGYYGYWDEAEVKYSTYWDAYYFTMPADGVVVYARFTDGATVDVITGDHGDAKVSSRYAEKGDWVYITAYPDEGYEVDSVTVTDSLGRSVKVTELSYDYFLFTMPGTNVDVKVTFRVKDYDVFYDVSRGDWYYKAVRFVHEKGIMEGTGTHYFSPEADLSRGMLATILYRLEGSPAVSGYSGFADVADTAYYAKAVAWAKANGIVNGVTATAYEPDTAVTREELAAILCRYAAFKGKDTAISYDYLAGFSDANTSHVYARPALNWAVAYDIINGQGNGVLAPRATATRAEVAQVLMNYLEVFD